MYKKIDFSKLGGFPGTQNTLDFIQKGYNDAISGLAKLCGDQVIVSGMEENGNHVADGWIVIDGEFLPFEGGSKQSTYYISENKETATFEDGNTHEVYFTRKAKFGSGSGQDLTYSDLKRLDDILKLKEDIGGLVSSLNSLNGTLSNHLQNKQNPHEVTKKQVGLENLPNFKSDSINLGSSDSLATSKAVKTLNDKFLLVGITQELTITSNQDYKYIYHHYVNEDPNNYIVLSNIVLTTSGSWDKHNDMSLVCQEKTNNSVAFLIHNFQYHTTSFKIEFLILKK